MKRYSINLNLHSRDGDRIGTASFSVSASDDNCISLLADSMQGPLFDTKLTVTSYWEEAGLETPDSHTAAVKTPGLRAAIERYADARENLSWSGSLTPAERRGAKDEYRAAKRALDALLNEKDA